MCLIRAIKRTAGRLLTACSHWKLKEEFMGSEPCVGSILTILWTHRVVLILPVSAAVKSNHVWMKLQPSWELELPSTPQVNHGAWLKRTLPPCVNSLAPKQKERGLYKVEASGRKRGEFPGPKPPSKGFHMQRLCRSWIIHDCKIDPLHGILVCKIMRMIPRSRCACARGCSGFSLNFPADKWTQACVFHHSQMSQILLVQMKHGHVSNTHRSATPPKMQLAAFLFHPCDVFSACPLTPPLLVRSPGHNSSTIMRGH